MKKYIIILVAFFSCQAFAQREVINLKDWQFAMETEENEMPQKDWQSVTLPHDWAITGEFSRDNDLQNVAITQNGEVVPSLKTGRTGGLPYPGIGWYRAQLSRHAKDADKVYTLYFDGAMSRAEVFVNGKKAKFWAYGYNAFYVDITPFLYNGHNEIAVRLNNKPESSRWYPGAGLYRKVELIKTEKTHIPVWGMQIQTKNLTNNIATVSVKTDIKSHSGKKVKVKADITLNGVLIASKTASTNPKKKSFVSQEFKITYPHLWSPESPSIYKAEITVYEGKKVVDKYTQPFGIKTIEITPEKGFCLNGKSRKFQGVCLHHDLGPLGAAAYRDAIQHQLEMLRDMGCDAIRTTHNMPSSDLVQLADSMGFMLMVEPFDEWSWGKCKNGYNTYFNIVEDGETQTWAERDIVNMVRHFRNNPSVVMWSIGNEIPNQCEDDGYKIAQFLQDICMREDGTRPITCGMDGVDCVLNNNFAATLQVVGINYRAHRYQEVYDKTPQKIVLGTETSSTVSSRGVYKLPAIKDDNSKICNVPQPNGNSKINQCTGYDLEYCPWSNIPDDDFRNMDDLPWTIGQFVWTGFDYLGEPSPWDTDAWPSHSSYFGIIDLASIPKDRYWLYRSQWNKRQHTLHLLPHWNWQEGDTVPVMIYTDLPQAELFLNGKSLGKKQFFTKEEAEQDSTWGHIRRYRLIWDKVPYEKGELKAVAYDNSGKQVLTDYRRTAGEPFYIELMPTKSGNLTYLRIRICDFDGNLCPNADNLVNIQVTGTGKMLGAANGDATCLIPFQSTQQQAFSGELTAIIEGNATVKVTAEGLKEGTIDIK